MSPIDHNLESTEKALKALKLKSFSEQLMADISNFSNSEQNFILKHLKKWTESELSAKKTSIIESKIRTAKFRQVQTVDNFNFDFDKITKNLKNPYMKLYNQINKDYLPSAMFIGSAGRGKTHLARALGYASCQAGIRTLFITAAEMVNHLSYAHKTLNLENEIKKYKRPQVLIIDELGYVSFDVQASNLFFQVISARHDLKLGTIATTNIPFGKFNQIFANDAIAHAIVDRLANTAEVFFSEGPSYREYQRRMRKKK